MTTNLSREGAPSHARTWARKDVSDLLDRLPDPQETRPAIQKLTRDQRDAIAEFVDGFDGRREYLEWAQRAAVATLGELDDDWLTDRAFSRLDLSTLLTSGRRFAWADDEADVLSEEKAATARRAVAAVDLLPACTRAHRRLRWSAVEYVNDESDSLQPDSGVQKHPAMRPALSEMSERQAWALSELLDGFAGDDALLAWVQIVSEASYAEVDGDRVSRGLVEGHTRDMLIVGANAEAETRHGRFFRESLAAELLLPAFNRAAREVSARSGEIVEQESKQIERNLI